MLSSSDGMIIRNMYVILCHVLLCSTFCSTTTTSIEGLDGLDYVLLKIKNVTSVSGKTSPLTKDFVVEVS